MIMKLKLLYCGSTYEQAIYEHYFFLPASIEVSYSNMFHDELIRFKRIKVSA